MGVKLLYHGPLWAGSTSLQRLESFQRLPAVTAIGHDSGSRVGGASSLWQRLRWKLRWPVDVQEENGGLLEAVQRERPDMVVVDNSKVIARSTLNALRQSGVACLAYYTPDDIIGRHNLSFPLKHSLPDWDIVFTTKTFNVLELQALGVKRPVLVGKAYDPLLHTPMTPAEVGTDYEQFDVVFVGSYEKQRCASLNAVAEAGFDVVVYGADKGGWRSDCLHPSIVMRQSVFAQDYRAAWHVGKLALCFLRKLNRDRITQRTMEIAAMGRPMLAEKTDEHDQHFADGEEYLGFRDDAELVNQVEQLLADENRRLALGKAARARCLASAYSTQDRACFMLSTMLAR